MQFDFIPVGASAGMSVITALCLVGMCSAGSLVVRYFWGQHSEIDSKICNHDKMINNIRIDIATLKTDVKNINRVVEKIDKNLTELAHINQQVILKGIEANK